jgi:hypothetical protein
MLIELLIDADVFQGAGERRFQAGILQAGLSRRAEELLRS